MDPSRYVRGVPLPRGPPHLPGASTDAAVPPALRAELLGRQLAPATRAGAAVGFDRSDGPLTVEHRFDRSPPIVKCRVSFLRPMSLATHH